MRKIKFSISVVLLFLIVFSVTPVTLYANSAQSWWSGTDSTGAIVTDEECPLIVENELLTFDIEEFPQGHYSDLDEFLSYSGKVTAEYTFYNPTDYKVDATLVFPFGNMPDYGAVYDHETETYAYNADTDKYDIKVNGEPIPKVLRHTLSLNGANAKFILENELPKLVLDKDFPELESGYLKDSFYSPDLPVHKYTYLAKDVDVKTYSAADAAIYVNTDNMKTRVYMENQSGGSASSLDKGVRINTWVDLEKEFSVYVFGKPLAQEFEWKFYANGACEEEIEGRMELVAEEDLLFKDFALSKYHENSGILEHDWYNAVVDLMNYHAWACGALHSTEINLDLSNQLMRWYEYKISVESGKRITNSVTAPIYPDIAGNYEPPVYQYIYLLSPAKTWKEFGNLDIVINSPYYMIESAPEGFEYLNPGYELHFTELPDGELYFKLSADADPKVPFNIINHFMWSFWPFLLLLVVFVGIMLLVVKGIDKMTSSKKNKTN